MSEPTLEEIKDNVEGLIANYQKKADAITQKIDSIQQEVVLLEHSLEEFSDERSVLLSTISDLRLAIGQK